MSTRAGIIFRDRYGNEFCADRSHDGFPEVVLPDLERAVSLHGHYFTGGDELGQLVSLFFGITYKDGSALQDYEAFASSNFAEDTVYIYLVEWSKGKRKYIIIVNPSKEELRKEEV